MVGQKLRVADGGHVLTPHCVALVPNGEQGDDGVIEVVTPSSGKLSHHGRVGGVS
jgi:hypothetical protein